jgi:hypothetical protein
MSHAVCRHWVSPPVGQTTLVAGFTRHFGGFCVKSQYIVPLHRLPSSLLAQSAFFWHTQVEVPDTHSPLTQLSELVHALPSSHVIDSLEVTPGARIRYQHFSPSHLWSIFSSGCRLHCPVLVSQLFLMQSESSTEGHVTTVAGLSLHLYTAVDLSQYFVPLHRLLSSLQSASLWHSHSVLVVPMHCPPSHASPVVHASPSLHGPLMLAWVHWPVSLSQPSVVHTLSSSHGIAVPPQVWAAHVSPVVHALLSLQVVPSGAGVALHEPSGWHTCTEHSTLLAGQSPSTLQDPVLGVSAPALSVSAPALESASPAVTASLPEGVKAWRDNVSALQPASSRRHRRKEPRAGRGMVDRAGDGRREGGRAHPEAARRGGCLGVDGAVRARFVQGGERVALPSVVATPVVWRTLCQPLGVCRRFSPGTPSLLVDLLIRTRTS